MFDSAARHCPICGQPSAHKPSGRGAKNLLCGKDDCQREANRRSSEAYRARRKGVEPPVYPDAAPVKPEPVSLPVAPKARLGDPVVTPYGTFPTLADAWSFAFFNLPGSEADAFMRWLEDFERENGRELLGGIEREYGALRQ